MAAYTGRTLHLLWFGIKDFASNIFALEKIVFQISVREGAQKFHKNQSFSWVNELKQDRITYLSVYP